MKRNMHDTDMACAKKTKYPKLKIPDVSITSVFNRAAARGDLETAEMCFLMPGAPFDVNYDYDVALRRAAQNGHLDFVRYLALVTCDIPLVYINIGGAFSMAVEHDHIDVVRYMMQHFGYKHCSHYLHAIVVGAKSPDMLRFLLHHVSINETEKDYKYLQDEALTRAVCNGNVDIADMLLTDYDIDPEYDRRIAQAARGREVDMLRFLVHRSGFKSHAISGTDAGEYIKDQVAHYKTDILGAYQTVNHVLNPDIAYLVSSYV